MKFGVKIFCDAKFADYFKDKADFLEVMAIEGKDYSFLKNYPLPIIIHAMHQGFGTNPADKTLFEKNLTSINFAISLADRFNAKRIILHLGILNSENCSIEQSVSFFQDLDKRIIFENIPLKPSLCSEFSEVEDFISKTGRNFCLDINHAIQTAGDLKIDFMQSIKGFLELKPVMYHIGGQKFEKGDIGHRSFDDSDIPLKEIFDLLPNDAEITLEVTREIIKTEKDLEFVRSLIT
ncbi:MAG: TIM barrel protein [archaeon]